MDTEPYVSPHYSSPSTLTNSVRTEGDRTDRPCYRCGPSRSLVILRKGLIPVCVQCFEESESRDFYLEMRAEDERLRRLGKRV